jgi:hypothetical protein
MRRLSVLIVLLSMLAAVVASPVAAARPDTASLKGDVYLVILADAPVVAYSGGITGLPATAPAAGKKVDPTSANVKNYVAYLDKTHADLVAKVGAGSTAKFYDYRYSLNGFAAVLTGGQAGKLRATNGVLAVEVDTLHRPTTDNSPTFLGLNSGDGLWADGVVGEDVIVGVIDTGIWPEHPSFSDQSDLADRSGDSGKRLRVYDAPPSYWHGTCQAGELWSTDDCNNKLIGARYFLAGFGKHGIDPKGDYKSARDHDGHGTHTSSTAAGNAGVAASIFGRSFGTVSGIAPRARVAIYKAIWNNVGGFSSDLAAAIDAAVADGVDVINYSIGSSLPNYTGADDIAFLFAARNGVYVASSAGNDGPSAETIGSPSADPWLTTVGASTQNRTFQATATLGNGASVTGASVTEALNSHLLVDSANLAPTGGAPADAELCLPGSLDPAKASGKIVLCLRGSNARVEKSHVVHDAGGVGMILYNPDDVMALVTDNHWVPSVHINFTDGTAVKNYINAAGVGATAAISAGTKASAQGSVMADFSSRGPNTAAPDIIKPDVTAPGVNILAGNTPTPFISRPGQLFQSISGTSMSSPHVAGIGALLTQAHRDWTPGMIKSALMTTGRQDVVKEDATTPADPFDFGAGHVVPNSATDPGLVYPTKYDDYIAFLCGATAGLVSKAGCDARAALGLSFDASDLNIASIGIANVVGSQSVTRTVMSVADGSTTWTATASVPGYDVTAPAAFTLADGATKTFQVNFLRTTAAFDEWAFGELVLSSGPYRVRSPIALRAKAIDAPAVVSANATAAAGSLTWPVMAGYNGTLSAIGYDLVADTLTPGLVVTQDPDQDPATDTLTSGMYVKDFALSGAQYLAGGTREATTEAGSDLDVYLLYETKDGHAGFTFDDLVAMSADGDSEEIVQLVHPADGNYKLLVHGWGTPDGASSFSLHQWVIDDSAPDAGTFEAHAGTGDPFTVSAGQVVTITGMYSGLTTTPTQYRGLVDYSDGAAVLPASTLVLLNR